MADLCCVYSYAGININATSGDCLILGEDGVTGLDGRPIRAEIDDQGQSDGGLFFPRFYGARIITFKGFCQIRSVTVEMNAPYYTALNALEAGVTSALEGQLDSAVRTSPGRPPEARGRPSPVTTATRAGRSSSVAR